MSSSQNSRVIDPSGISYAVTNGHKDGEPKIIERDTPMKGNYEEPRICTMVGRDPNNPSSRVHSDHYEQMHELGDDVSNTLTSVQKDNLVAEPTIIQNGHGFNKGGVHYIAPTVTSSKFQENNFVSEPEDVDFAEYTEDYFRKSGKDYLTPIEYAHLKAQYYIEKREKASTSYRIRKLTPRECFRLMGVSETDIDKIQQSGVSQSQQYKMAGNSIVVDCLFHIFRKMFAETHDESRQLSLF